MQQADTLQRFLFEEWQIRGEIVRLQSTYADVSKRHTYAPFVQQILAQALAATALLSATIKFAGKLSLQIQSEGSISLLLVQSDQNSRLRGIAKSNEEIADTNFIEAFSNGRMALTIAPEKGEQYQGIVPLSGNNLAESLEGYFYQSEQLPTAICLFADNDYAAGMLLQALPGEYAESRFDFWERLVGMMHTLSFDELITYSNQELLQQLYPADPIRLFAAQPVSFHCDCTVERMENALKILGYQEVEEILKEQKNIEVTCEFCHYCYRFSATDIQRIFIDDTDS